MIERFFVSGFEVKENSPTKDGTGGVKPGWATKHSDISGKLWPVSGSQRTSAGREGYFIDHCFVTGETDIKKTDRLIDPDGREFEVKGVYPRKRPDGSGHVELDLELMK